MKAKRNEKTKSKKKQTEKQKNKQKNKKKKKSRKKAAKRNKKKQKRQTGNQKKKLVLPAIYQRRSDHTSLICQSLPQPNHSFFPNQHALTSQQSIMNPNRSRASALHRCTPLLHSPAHMHNMLYSTLRAALVCTARIILPAPCFANTDMYRAFFLRSLPVILLPVEGAVSGTAEPDW